MPKAKRIGAVYQRIREWLMYDGDERRPSRPKLWDGDEEVWKRLVQLRALYFQKAHSYQDALTMMMKTEGITESTFHRDHRGLIYILGDLSAESKEFEKQRLKEIAMKTLQMALKGGDVKGANGAMANLIKLGGHDRDEKDAIPLEMLNPGAYALVADDTAQKALSAMANGAAVIDLSEMIVATSEVEDIEHEEVSEKAPADD